MMRNEAGEGDGKGTSVCLRVVTLREAEHKASASGSHCEFDALIIKYLTVVIFGM